MNRTAVRNIAAAGVQLAAGSGGPVLWVAMTPKRSHAAATLGATMRERIQVESLVVMAAGL
jgi:hypothetical protein